MSDSLPPPLVDVVRSVVGDLVNGEYKKLEAITRGVRLNASELGEAVRQYGATLRIPPESAFENLDAIQARGTVPRQWSVRFDLWTEEEGRSDLSLEMTVIEASVGGSPLLEIDNLHVL
jgi:hypothetical protein